MLVRPSRAHPAVPEPEGAAGHQVAVTERGSFASAACTCGWAAPARRSRDKARRDAAEHRAAAERA
ncbi:hypothetical protein [Streptomyces tateyamensis]|uniref:hypothetical protein n=1 Tax=Streptomyces tateyamensis TaxID=565073 RepID=UPI0011B7062A|nr:hypothetical protein [Streptomyces tateyamensis]